MLQSQIRFKALPMTCLLMVKWRASYVLSTVSTTVRWQDDGAELPNHALRLNTSEHTPQAAAAAATGGSSIGTPAAPSPAALPR